MNAPLVMHPEAAQLLQGIIAGPPHAAILAGGLGTGKTHLARSIAGQLLGIDAENGDKQYFKELEPIKGTVTIEQVRELIRFFQLSVPGKAAIKRVAVVFDADAMSTEAQNALLKLLEEPPVGSVLLLTTSRLQGLLPTIRSRAQLFTLPDPSPAHLQQYFTDQGYNESDVRKAVARFGSNVAAISQALEGQTDDDTSLDLVKQVLKGTSFERLVLVDSLYKQREYVLAFIDTLAVVAMASLNAAARAGNSFTQWQRVLEAANTAQEALSRSGNTKLVLTELMLSL